MARPRAAPAGLARVPFLALRERGGPGGGPDKLSRFPAAKP
jgi:hypothetical protein